MEKNKYYKNLDLLRLISCIAILLYHLNILKGGFLAVCIFFTLSGYLSYISISKKDKFSLKDYYLNKLKKLYLPLLIVIFITISIISLIPSINWLNLKPETTSILLSYNNFWQLKANLDYFARHIDSPFMHLWYISILLQFDLIFPIIYLVINKLFKNKKEEITCIISGILGFISYGYFYQASTTGNIMVAYYNTFSRLFSILLGLSFASIKPKYNNYLPKKLKDKKLDKIVVFIYIVILLSLLTFIDTKTPYFEISMLLTTILTIRLIDYSTLYTKKKLNKKEKIIKSLSNITYEIYLVQYPIIYLFQSITLNNYIKIPLIILLTILISYLLHYSINIKKEDKYKLLKILSCILISILSMYGLYKYIIEKDHTKEMKQLEEQLEKNKLLTEQKQKEYLSKIKDENNNWQETLNDLENGEQKLKEIVTNLPVVGIGDSVMLGAINNLYQTFPNGYFDASVSRTDYEANPILVNLKNKGLLGDIVIFNLGTNGEGPEYIKEQILSTIGNRKIFWLNATKPDFPSFNTEIVEFANKHDNITIIDWVSASSGHQEYFVSDGIHLTREGSIAYANTIYNSIYQTYLDEYNKNKESKIKEHEQKLKTKITFIGNDLLINAYEYLEKDYKENEFITNSNYTYKSLKEEIIDKKNNNTLSYNIIFFLDSTFNINKEEYEELINICNNHKIIIITTKELKLDNKENVNVINFYSQIKKHNNYLMPDKIHLSKEGNEALSNLIKDTLK